MDNNNPQDDQFNASLLLPPDDAADTNTAADLIRQKVQAAYEKEPDAAAEALDVAELGVTKSKSRHQKFVSDLMTSGKSLEEIQTAWHEYYAGLTDVEKHAVWQEFYDMHSQASRFAAAAPVLTPQASQPLALPKESSVLSSPPKHTGTLSRTAADLKAYVLGGTGTHTKLKPAQHFQSLLFGLGMGSVVILILLFGFFNERFIAPFIQPSRVVSNTPIISDTSSGSTNPEIIIPKINVQIPVVYGVNTIDETSVLKALEQGVVHYADTAVPGQNGNVVIVGHSSNNIFNKGKYKFAFVLLSRLDSGDTFYLQKDGKRYTYQVYEKKVVKPTDVSVLAPKDKPATATLITCDPPGTSTNRLVVVGQQISPDPSSNLATAAQTSIANKTVVIPGNSPSLWSRIIKLLSS